VVLDSLLVMVAATALSWYFLLEPIYTQSSQSLLGKITNLAYPVGDLGVLFGLVLVLVYRRSVERSVLLLLIGAVACLAIADSWYTAIDLNTTNYISGGPDDLFWMACYVLFPLAGLVHFRLAQRENTLLRSQQRPTPQPQIRAGGAFIESLRFLLPFVAALLAGGVIIIQAMDNSSASNSPLIPLAVVFGLFILVIARQELTFLEGEHWRREREVARSNEVAALKEAKQQMDTFLGMASHELKTPLSSIKLGLQVQIRRMLRLAHRDGSMTAEFEPVLEGLARAEWQELRLEHLINDLLDVSRIQAGRLELRPEWTDLVCITRAAVEEQQQAMPGRPILLRLPADLHIPVYADANRVEQVVTNYLTNALKYSPEDRPVKVGVQEGDTQAGVWVRDEGPGLPVEEQHLIWERFHRARGIEVQSGTGIGLGIGLYICRTIIERHHGAVGVESAPGKGSTFWFTLPRSIPSEAVRQAE
jgi:signal transduction histidine kinase